MEPHIIHHTSVLRMYVADETTVHSPYCTRELHTPSSPIPVLYPHHIHIAGRTISYSMSYVICNTHELHAQPNNCSSVSCVKTYTEYYACQDNCSLPDTLTALLTVFPYASTASRIPTSHCSHPDAITLQLPYSEYFLIPCA
jgi:hypothetical protein